MVRGCNLIAGDEALNMADSAFYVGDSPSVTWVSPPFFDNLTRIK